MKKKLKTTKLELNRETVKLLTSAERSLVLGGADGWTNQSGCGEGWTNNTDC